MASQFAEASMLRSTLPSLLARRQVAHSIAIAFQSTGKSQSDVAKTCGLSQPRMSKLLSGKVEEFSLDALVDVASRLGVSVSFVIGDSQR